MKNLNFIFKLLLFSILFFSTYAAANNDSCPGTLYDTLSSSDRSYSNGFSVRKDDDPNDYLQFKINESGYITIDASDKGYDKNYHFSVSKTVCGGTGLYPRTNAKNHSITQIPVSAGETIYIRIDAVGSSNNEKRGADLTVTWGATLKESCPGVIIPTLDGTATSAVYNFNGESINNNKDYYYNFTPTAAGTFRVDVTNSNKYGYDLRVMDGCGSNIKSNTNNTNNKSITNVSVSAGQMIVVRLDRNYNTTMNYNIKFTYVVIAPAPPNISVPNQTVQIGNPLSIPLSNYTSEPNGDDINYTATGLPPGMSLNPDTGDITGTPTTNVGSPFTVTVTATDKDGSDSDNFTITVTVPPVVAAADSFTTPPNTPISDNFMSNDSGYNIQATAITLQPSHGTVTYQSGGFFTYTPTVGYEGLDNFTYRITDPFGSSATATVTINVALNTNYQSGLQNFVLINPLNTRNIIGNYAIAGNTVECITTDEGGTAGYPSTNFLDFRGECTNSNNNDNNYMSKYIDIDNDNKTWNSSSSNFTLPSTNSGILWAGLFWQGAINNWYWYNQRRAYLDSSGNVAYKYITSDQSMNLASTSDITVKGANKVLLKLDNETTYSSIQASTYFYDPSFGDSDQYGGYYAAYSDVTYELQRRNLSDGNHTITIANLTANEGRESDTGDIGGWSLVVIYGESGGGAKARNISIYNGYTTIYDGSGTRSVKIQGFKLPSSGNVNSTFSSFAGEGEEIYSPDRMFISKNSNLSSPQNMPGARDINNIFDARLANIQRDSGNNNNVTNANGIDLDSYDVSSIMTNYRNADANINTVYIGLYSGGDYITPSMMAFATELYRPKVCIDYTVQKDRYDITQDGRAIDTQGTGDLSVTLALQSLEGDFDFINSQIGVRLVPTDNTSFANAYYAPNNVNTFIQGIPAGGTFNPPANMMGIGEHITSTGGTIRRYQRYFARFDYNLLGTYSGRFEVDLNTTINFGSGEVPSYQSTQYDDIQRCEQNLTYNPIKGSFNVERTDSGSYNGVTQPELKYPLYTQVVGKNFDFRLVAYNQSSTPAYTTELPLTDHTVDLELIDAAPFNDAQSVFTCNNPDPNIIQELNSTSHVKNLFVKFPDSTKGESAISSISLSSIPDRALKNAAFRMWYIVDENNTILPHLCDETDNGCFETLYNAHIKSSDTTVHKDSSGNTVTGFCQSACSASSGYNYTNHAGKSGCYACLHDFFSRAVCSRDNFSIKPVSYRIKLSDNGENTDPTVASTQVAENDTTFTPPLPFSVTTLAAGYQYKLDGIATSYLGDTSVALGYYRKFNTPNSAITSELSFDTNYGTNNVNTVNCVDKNNTYWNVKFYNGTMQNINDYTVSNLKTQSQVGQYLYHVEDANWTLVDQDTYQYKTFHGVNDCNPTSSSVASTSTGKSGCKISSSITVNGQEYTDLTLRYRPYKFDLSGIKYVKHPNNGKSFTYLNDFDNAYYSSLLVQPVNTSISFEGNITALAKDNTLLTNFTNKCVANDITLHLSRTTAPNAENNLRDANGALVPLQQYLQETSPYNAFADTQSGVDANITLHKAAFLNNTNQGIATMFLHTTFKKPLNAPVNPFRIKYQDLNATGKLLKSFANGTTHTPIGGQNYDQNTTYYFAKITPLKTLYPNVTVSFQNTPIYIDFYCDPAYPCSSYDLNLSSKSPNETTSWHDASPLFDNTTDGTTNLIAMKDAGASANESVSPNTNVPFTDGNASRTDINVTVTGSARPTTVGVDIRPVPWLLYDPINANGYPHFQVQFIDSAGWSGIGNTGKVVETKSSSETNSRMNW